MKRLWTRFLFAALAAALAMPDIATAAGPLRFYSLVPCRIVDTRGPVGPVGGPKLAAGPERSFPIKGYCGVPSTAQAAALNLLIIFPSGAGHLVMWRYGGTRPTSSVINYATNDVLANGAVIELSTGAPLTNHVTVVSVAATDLVIDVYGYYAP